MRPTKITTLTKKVNLKTHFEKLLTDFVNSISAENLLLRKMIYFLYGEGLEIGCFRSANWDHQFKDGDFSFFMFESHANIDRDLIKYIREDISGWFSWRGFIDPKISWEHMIRSMGMMHRTLNSGLVISADLHKETEEISKPSLRGNKVIELDGYEQIDQSDPSSGWLSRDGGPYFFGFIFTDYWDLLEDPFECEDELELIVYNDLSNKFFSLIEMHDEVESVNYYRRVESEDAVDEDCKSTIDRVIVVKYKSGVCEGLVISEWVD